MQQWAPHTVQIMKNNTPLGLVLVPCQAGGADQGHELTSGLFTGVSNRAIKTKAGPCSSFVSAQTAQSGVAAPVTTVRFTHSGLTTTWQPLHASES